MCYLETHSCACTEAWKRKIVHRRAIACLPEVDCLARNHRGTDPNFWTATYVKECVDFHKGPDPTVPYRCPMERIDETPVSQSYTEPQLESEVLRYIDMDYVTFHDHLDKTASAASGDFSKSSYSTGDVDADEYIDVRYKTGWMFNRLADGTLVRVADGTPREREEGFDHTTYDKEPTAEEWAVAMASPDEDAEVDNGEERDTNTTDTHPPASNT